MTLAVNCEVWKILIYNVRFIALIPSGSTCVLQHYWPCSRLGSQWWLMSTLHSWLLLVADVAVGDETAGKRKPFHWSSALAGVRKLLVILCVMEDRMGLKPRPEPRLYLCLSDPTWLNRPGTAEYETPNLIPTPEVFPSDKVIHTDFLTYKNMARQPTSTKYIAL